MKNLRLCIVYIVLIVTFSACVKDPTQQKPSDELVTLGSPMESTAPGISEWKTEAEIKTIGYAPLTDGWTEVVSEQCSRLYSETGLAAIVMNDVISSNAATFGDITDMETYVKNKMSIQYVLKSAEQVESEYGNTVNKIIVGAGEPELEELHYVVISPDGDVVVDIVVVDENCIEEVEKFAKHISIR